METRQRGARQRQAESHNASATASNSPLTSRDSPADAGSDNPKRGSLSRDAIARRGAKVSKAVSVASIPTMPGHESEYEDEAEEEDDEERSRPQSSLSVAPQHGDGSEADEDDMGENMIAGLPDLERAADELMARLSNGYYGDKKFRAILNVKKRAFIHHQKNYLQPDAPSPFVDWAWLKDLERPTETEKSAANVFARANLVSALSYIQDTRARGGDGMLELLEALDSAIPTLLTPRPKMAVNVRACYAIELLALSSSKTNLSQIIASVFCRPTGSEDFVDMIKNGPFRSLGDLQDKDESDLCSTTAHALYMGGRTKSGMDPLREMFPLDELLEELEEWIRDEYPKLQESDYHDVEEDFEESTSASIPESQPIVRAGNTDKSLFENTQSVRQLDKAIRSHDDAPPSNQQHAARKVLPMRAPAAPFSSDRQMLQAETPTPDHVVNPAMSRAKPAHAVPVEDDEEEEEWFETDGRPVDYTKRAAIQSVLPARKRVRSSAAEPQPSSSQQTYVNPSTARAAPSSAAPAGRMSSQVDLDALRRKSADTSAAARIQQRGYRGGHQTRVPWSEADAMLLIELVCETNASWSIIERKYNKEFEYPRNQQAYRDKARNLKVDFLLADAVLPPGFDHVALSPKEIIKVRAKGKNHMRSELDIDNRGNPTNTAADA